MKVYHLLTGDIIAQKTGIKNLGTKNGSKVASTVKQKNTVGVNVEWIPTPRAAATNPRISTFTVPLPKKGFFFNQTPMFASIFLTDEKR